LRNQLILIFLLTRPPEKVTIIAIITNLK